MFMNWHGLSSSSRILSHQLINIHVRLSMKMRECSKKKIVWRHVLNNDIINIIQYKFEIRLFIYKQINWMLRCWMPTSSKNNSNNNNKTKKAKRHPPKSSPGKVVCKRHMYLIRVRLPTRFVLLSFSYFENCKRASPKTGSNSRKS